MKALAGKQKSKIEIKGKSGERNVTWICNQN